MPHASQEALPGREIELKLALPAIDGAALLQQLTRSAALRRRKTHTYALHNIYFDTADQLLRQQRTALRLRRVDDGAATHWLQTLKTGRRDMSALSHRSEWETPVAGPALERQALDAAAWKCIDPRGDLFTALQPMFVTDFERTVWLLKRRDGSVVEVALDIGKVSGSERSSALCELELELKAGPVTALFDIAADIAATLPVLPLAMSKAQRGYALASDDVNAAALAEPPKLKRGMSLRNTAQEVLREMFGQFTGNLVALRHSDNPEVVHQARVAWRRFRSARRLFKPMLGSADMPSWQALEPLLGMLGEVRDLDVACCDTLPTLRDAYVAQSASRAYSWDLTIQLLTRHADERRTAARLALLDPSVGLCLLQTMRWLDTALASAQGEPESKDTQTSLRRWATRRATRLHERLERAGEHARDTEARHDVRILAKRTRYSIDALRDVLPKHIAGKWYRQAVDTQKSIGSDRDLHQAVNLLERFQAPDAVAAFLRGVVAGRGSQRPDPDPSHR